MGRVFRDHGNLCLVIQLFTVRGDVSPTYFMVQDMKLLAGMSSDFGELVYDED